MINQSCGKLNDTNDSCRVNAPGNVARKFWQMAKVHRQNELLRTGMD